MVPNPLTPPGPFAYERPMEEGVASISADALGRPDAHARLDRLVDEAARLADGALADARRIAPPPYRIACKAGCPFCCHRTQVTVSPAEVLRIVRYIATHFSREAMTALVERAWAAETERVERLRHPWERPGHPCPLLVDRRCSVHPVRPLSCRGFNSYSAHCCELHIMLRMGDVPIEGYVHQERTAGAAYRGLKAGAARRGLEADDLNLVPALLIALADADAGWRWLAGERLFEPARLVATGADDSNGLPGP